MTEPTPVDPVEPADVDDEKWPVGFIIILVLAALYLGWRLIELIAMGIDWVF